MVIIIPFFQHIFSEVTRPNQPGSNFAGQSKITTIDAAHQILTGNRHVFWIATAKIIMAFVGTGAAFHAAIKIDPERAIALAQDHPFWRSQHSASHRPTHPENQDLPDGRERLQNYAARPWHRASFRAIQADQAKLYRSRYCAHRSLIYPVLTP